MTSSDGSTTWTGEGDFGEQLGLAWTRLASERPHKLLLPGCFEFHRCRCNERFYIGVGGTCDDVTPSAGYWCGANAPRHVQAHNSPSGINKAGCRQKCLFQVCCCARLTAACSTSLPFLQASSILPHFESRRSAQGSVFMLSCHASLNAKGELL